MNACPSSKSVNKISNIDVDNITNTMNTTNIAPLSSTLTLMPNKSSESNVSAFNNGKIMFPINSLTSLNFSNNAINVNVALDDDSKICTGKTNVKSNKFKQAIKPSNRSSIKRYETGIIFPPKFTRVFLQKVYYANHIVSLYFKGNSLNILEKNFITNKQSNLKSQATTNMSASAKTPTTMMTQSTNLATDMIYNSLNLHREQNQWQETQVHCESSDLDCLSNEAYTFDFAYDGILNRAGIYRKRNALKMYALKQSSTRVIIEHIQAENMKRILSSTRSYDKANRLFAFILTPIGIELATIVLEEKICNSIEQAFSNIVPLYILVNAFTTINDYISAFSSDIHARPEFAGHKQPPMVERQYFSDVRDTSSQKVLVSIARAQFKTCPSALNQGTATEPEPSQSALLSTLSTTPFKSSFFVRVECILLPQLPPFTSSKLNFCLWYDELPNFNLLPKYTEYSDWTELRNKWIYIIECSASISKQVYQGIKPITITRTKRYPQLAFDDLIENKIQIFAGESGTTERESYRPCQARTEMTITTFEEHDEAAVQLQSEPSSPVISSGNRQEEINDLTDILNEMKFEMRATKSPLASSSPQDRFKAGLSSGLSSTPKNTSRLHSQAIDTRGVARSQLPSLATNTHGQLGTSRRQQPQQCPSYGSGIKPTDLPSNRQYEKVPSETLLSSNVAPVRSISVDTVESLSTLPARTRLRRQRRMGSQESTEQPEDPIERLNRLRARISGALSEVKGVLNKYSTETDPSDEVTQKEQKIATETPLKDDGPVQFRFIRKVRRRSVFNEDEESKIVSQVRGTETLPEKTGSEEASLNPESTGDMPNSTEKCKDSTTAVGLNLSEKEPQQVTNIPKIEIAVSETKSSNERKRDNDSSGEKEPSSKNSTNTNKTLKAEIQSSKRRVSIATVEEIASDQSFKAVKAQRRPSDSATVLKKITEIKGESNKETIKVSREISKKCLHDTKDSKLSSVAELQTKPLSISEHSKQTSSESVKLDKSSDKQTTSPEAKGNQSIKVKPEKRVPTKKTANFRRSSIAVVESSKIERPVSDNITPDVKAQRRPSDSAAVIKKIAETKENNSLSRGKIEPKNALKSITHIKGSSTDPPVMPLIGNESQAPISSNVVASNKSNKQIKTMPTNSIKENNDEAPTTPPKLMLPPLLATVIGRATTAPPIPTATAFETAVTQLNKTDISDDIKDSISPLKSDGHENANVAAAISISQVNETNSQQAQSGLSPNVHRISGKSAVSVKKFIPPSADNRVQENNDLQLEQKDKKSSPEQVIKPPETVATNATINQITTKIESADSRKYSQPGTQSPQQDDNIKKPIHQQKIIPAAINKPETSSTQSTQLTSLSVQGKSLQTSASSSTSVQQVAVDAELAPIAIGDDIRVNDRVPEIFQPTAKKSLSEVDIAASLEISVIQTDISTGDASTKANATTVTTDSGFENIIASTKPIKSIATSSKSNIKPKLIPETKVLENMPELQVLPAPVKAVQVHPVSEISPPFGEPKEVFPKKKILLKKIGRKSSTDKTQPPKIINEKEQDTETKEFIPQTETEQEVEIPQNSLSDTPEATENLEILQAPDVEEPPALPKPLRKVKKKVIIKRLQRRLSATEQSFFLGENDEKPLPDVETIEKAIAYVSDDDEDDHNNSEDKESDEPIKPVKSCMRLREYQVGDLVMYAERYRKTLIRWKRGRVMERITSISYKIDIDGKEVSAHINYLKKYTGRKVRFGDKEYLEIDYEQIPEEEKKVRSYNIWNLV